MAIRSYLRGIHPHVSDAVLPMGLSSRLGRLELSALLLRDTRRLVNDASGMLRPQPPDVSRLCIWVLLHLDRLRAFIRANDPASNVRILLQEEKQRKDDS